MTVVFLSRNVTCLTEFVLPVTPSNTPLPDTLRVTLVEIKGHTGEGHTSNFKGHTERPHQTMLRSHPTVLRSHPKIYLLVTPTKSLVTGKQIPVTWQNSQVTRPKSAISGKMCLVTHPKHAVTPPKLAAQPPRLLVTRLRTEKVKGSSNSSCNKKTTSHGIPTCCSGRSMTTTGTTIISARTAYRASQGQRGRQRHVQRPQLLRTLWHRLAASYINSKHQHDRDRTTRRRQQQERRPQPRGKRNSTKKRARRIDLRLFFLPKTKSETSKGPRRSADTCSPAPGSAASFDILSEAVLSLTRTCQRWFSSPKYGSHLIGSSGGHLSAHDRKKRGVVGSQFRDLWQGYLTTFGKGRPAS